jgi:hypothetical protein
VSLLQYGGTLKNSVGGGGESGAPVASSESTLHRETYLVPIKKGKYEHRNYTWNGVPPEKTVVAELALKFLALHGKRRFITVFTTDRNWSLS